MRILFLLLALASFRSFADTSAQCELVNGIYKNSSIHVYDLRFGTLVDVFTLSNANSLSINLGGSDLKFIRSDISVNRQTRMVYHQKKNGFMVRTIHVMIDRTPKEVAEAREFFGNMIIFPEGNDLVYLKAKSLVYNFHCQF